jgi:hypothetical protein
MGKIVTAKSKLGTALANLLQGGIFDISRQSSYLELVGQESCPPAEDYSCHFMNYKQ